MINIICNECETVAHCMNNGCVPKQPAYRAVKTYHEGKPVYVAEQPVNTLEELYALSKEVSAEEALKLALEALESIEWHGAGSCWVLDDEKVESAEAALREALAEQPEPVQPGRNHYEDGDVFERIAAMKKQPAQQEPVWSDAGDLKRLKKGDVLRVLRKGQEYYSAFRFDGLLQECDYTYDGDAPFVWLEVDMATLDKIVYTRKDLTTGAIYADRGDRVELFQPIDKEALAQQPAPATQLREQEPVAVHQFRNRYVTDWYDGVPDHQDGHGPYEVRTLYTSLPIEATPLAQRQARSADTWVVPDALTAQDPETLEYILGWNDCRQLMMEMLRKEIK